MIDIEVEDAAWTAAEPACAVLAEISARAVLSRLTPGREGGLVILLTDNPSVQDLNSRYLGKDKPTNVLSFPAAGSAGDHIGDIALAFGVCAAEADEQGKPLAHHLQHLVAHGVLHLLGYDHEDDADAVIMENLEREILAGLGVPDPYAWTDRPD